MLPIGHPARLTFRRNLMPILGLGLDLVELSRVERSLHHFGEHFLRRILTETEYETVPRPLHTSRCIAHVAARFAAKEAAVKALGTGFAQGIGPKDIGVRNNELGRPELVLSGRAKALAEQLGAVTLHLTLTHTRDNAAAVVILEG